MKGRRRFVLYSAGSNAAGQLGAGDVEDRQRWTRCSIGGDEKVDFPPSEWHVVRLSSGASHTVAIVGRQEERQVWACGSGEHGQLGARLAAANAPLTSFTRLCIDALQRPRWRVESVECGWEWTFFTLRDVEGTRNDEILVLGQSNDFGQLGLGAERGSDVQRVGEKFVESVEIGKTLSHVCSLARWTVREVCCGLRHTLVLCASDVDCDNRRLYALLGWGATRHGQVVRQKDGKGKARAIAWLPHLLQAWTAVEGDSGDERDASRSRRPCAQLSAGKEHSAIYVPVTWTPLPGGQLASMPTQRSDGILLFGSNRQGQLDLPDHATAMPTDSRIVALDCTWNATLLAYSIDDGNAVRVIGAGSNAKGQLGRSEEANGQSRLQNGNIFVDDGSALARDKVLVCGSEHVVLLTGEKGAVRIFGWGWNEHGNLAVGDTNDRHSPVQIWPSPLDDRRTMQATDVYAGCGTTFVQLEVYD